MSDIPRVNAEDTLYYQETEEYLSSASHLIRFIVGDSARTSSSRSDPAAFLAVAIDLQAGKVYFREYLQLTGEQASPGGYTDELIALAGRTNSWIFALDEKTDPKLQLKVAESFEDRDPQGRTIKRKVQVNRNDSFENEGLKAFKDVYARKRVVSGVATERRVEFHTEPEEAALCQTSQE